MVTWAGWVLLLGGPMSPGPAGASRSRYRLGVSWGFPLCKIRVTDGYGFEDLRIYLVALTAMCLMGSPVAAQWINQRTPGIPRTADGKPALSAPLPRTADGRPDLSGIWQPEADPAGVPGGVEGIVAPRYLINVTRDLKPEDVPFQPWAEALYRQRAARFWTDNPLIRCLPVGVPRLDAYTHPYKILQTPGVIVVLYEAATFRQIFTDGRALPVDPQPAWMGYSIGRWEGDTLVVDTIGVNDNSWLDGSGHPHSGAMHLIERFQSDSVGHMDIQVTVDDPKTYTRPLTYTQRQELLPDTDLLEFVCNENEKFGAKVPQAPDRDK